MGKRWFGWPCQEWPHKPDMERQDTGQLGYEGICLDEDEVRGPGVKGRGERVAQREPVISSLSYVSGMEILFVCHVHF